MRIAIVVAATENGVIGDDNRLIWRLPDDLKRFKSLTMGKPILMGRKTYESIGKPLPGRTNIVITRNRELALPGCIVVNSVTQGIETAAAAGPETSELAVIGGAEIYAQALSSTDVIHLTRVHATLQGDAVFPSLDPAEWVERSIERHPADERHAFAFSFVEIERRHAD